MASMAIDRNKATLSVKYFFKDSCFRDQIGNSVLLVKDEDRNVWNSPDGGTYIQNSSIERDPTWLRVDGLVWSGKVGGVRHTINWVTFNLPMEFIRDFRRCISHRLRNNSISQFSSLNSLLRKIGGSKYRPFITGGVGDLPRHVLMSIFRDLSRHERSYFRSCYRTMHAIAVPGCTRSCLSALEEISALRRKAPLEAVSAWHQEDGALTTAELDALRDATAMPKFKELERDHLSRLLLRIMQLYGRRPVQIAGVAANGVYRSPYHEGLPAIIEFPGAKSQRNDAPRSYDLPKDLYSDLMAYALRKEVANAQKRTGLFFVSTTDRARLTTTTILRLVQQWAKSAKIVSPRTGSPLRITGSRLRHTVATQLARRGWSTEDIAEFLEHSSSVTAKIYVDAAGRDLEPHLQNVNRRLNGLFDYLAGSFRGQVVARPIGKIDKPIMVPHASNKSIIGSCGLKGNCEKSPFTACLGGCPQFLLFKDVDLTSARNWVTSESERWAKAERSAARASSIDDFSRIIKT